MTASGKLDPPLADYFWIAGIDSVSYGEYVPRDTGITDRRSFSDQLLEAIDAQGEDETQDHNYLSTSDATNGSSQRRTANGHSSSNGAASPSNRLSGSSAGSGIDSVQQSRSNTPSDLVRNSSTSSNSTITDLKPRTGKKDFDFDTALLKFAAERDIFLEDLSFSAGTILPKKPLTHPRAQKVVSEDMPKLEKTGSIRRRISLRDLTSMRRSPSVVNRAGESSLPSHCVQHLHREPKKLMSLFSKQPRYGQPDECPITTL